MVATTRPTYTRHSTSLKNRFAGALKAGASVKTAAEQENIPLQTGYNLRTHLNKHGTVSTLPRSGRPRKATRHVKQQVLRNAREHRRKPFREIGKEVVPQVGEGTVRTVLAEEGYHRRVARKVVWLTVKQRQSRVRWAKQQRGRTAKEWGSIIWSDECYVYVGDTCGRTYVTRRVDEEYDGECVIPTFKQSSTRVMVWGCIIEGRRGPLVVLEYEGGKGGGFNAVKYRDQVLEPVLKEFYAEMEREKGVVFFQQDGAPAHKAKLTSHWFTSHNIKLFPHPASSPDVSAVESCWLDLKSYIRALPHMPTSLNSLIAAVHDAWNSISVNRINNLISRMPERVEAVLAARGGPTKF